MNVKNLDIVLETPLVFWLHAYCHFSHFRPPMTWYRVIQHTVMHHSSTFT